MLRVANSTPMVLLLSRLNSFRVNRESRLLFPTPESPINTTVEEKETERETEGGDGKDEVCLYTVCVMGEVEDRLYILIDPRSVDMA